MLAKDDYIMDIIKFCQLEQKLLLEQFYYAFPEVFIDVESIIKRFGCF